MDKLKVGNRIWNQATGRHGRICGIYADGIAIEWLGCGHCGLAAERKKVGVAFFGNKAVHVYPAATGTCTASRS